MSSESPAAGPQPYAGPRRLDDAVVMRALAHPVRIRLLEELTLRGPMTATEASSYVGESPSSCSFHLRTLAKYGFVEEAPGGKGRQRPWRAVSIGNRWESGPGTPPAERAAADALAAQVRRRDGELLDEYLAHQDEMPPEWVKATIHSNFGSWLTADELAAIGEQLLEIWQPYLARLQDPTGRPEGSRLVHMSVHGFPRADVNASTATTRTATMTSTTSPGEDDDA